MRGVRRGRRWKGLMQRLRFKGIGCCGGSWRFGAPPAQFMSGREEMVGGEEERSGNSGCVNRAPAATAVMNLAAALAAERNSSRGEKMEKSLMRMLEEVEGDEDGEEIGGGEGEGGGMLCCCICMERRKGAAFIPCGHTYCRLCSRELWLTRGSCPLCNSAITQVLNIF